VTDRETRQAILEAIRADIRSRIDLIMIRFVHRAYEAAPLGEAADVLDEAVSEVSDVLSEGMVAQAREGGRMHPGSGTR
jgi:hypothetical protein